MGHLCLIMGGTFWNGEGARGALAPPQIFDLRAQILRADDRLLSSLSHQPPQSYFHSATTASRLWVLGSLVQYVCPQLSYLRTKPY